MNITLCQLNSQFVHSALAPWYLAAAAQQLCTVPHTIHVAQGTVNQTDDALIELLCQHEPELLGLSCYIWNVETLRRLLPKLRTALPHTVFVLGGPEVSFCAEAFLAQNPQVDYILCGEGERSFAALADTAAGVRGIEEVPGLCRRTENGIVCSAPPAPLEELFDPYTDAYFEALGGRIPYIETTRGCPFTCAFCLSGREDRLRCFSLDAAFTALLKLAASGAKTIKFIDRTFNANEPRARRIWEFLAQKRAEGLIPEGVCFHFEVAADLFTADCLAFLASVPAGLFQFEAGLQSFHPETLAAVQRKTDLDKLCRNLTALLAPGNLHLHIDLIAGLPHEDLATFTESFDRAFALGAHQLQLGFLKLIHGSALRRDADAYGMRCAAAAPYEITENQWLSPADLARLTRAEQALDLIYNSGRYHRSLPYLLSLWQGGAFAFFSAFSAMLVPLGEYPAAEAVAECFYRFGCGIAGIKPALLRDLLALDTLSSRRAMRLPDFLKVRDDRLRRINLLVRTGDAHLPDADKLPEKFHAGKIGFCILYSGYGCCSDSEVLALFDYSDRNPVTGAYAVTTLPLREALGEPAGECPVCRAPF
ncbi:MAG: DUF4080 domain-containing protein [Pygmaiobacter massiliensis]|nr:DUF4080 domain-containing protein [Pygmaiobacter massiliensis]